MSGHVRVSAKGNYGVDSPAIVGTLCVLGLAGTCVAYLLPSAWRWAGYVPGIYFLLGAAGMVFYSKVGKLALRERLLDKISWQGDEQVLDVGCGRGLLTVGAAHRLSKGKVIGVDVWQRGAINGNRADSVLENAQIEHVSDRVEIKEGDARELPFANETFDVVVSNFVVHEMNTRQERETMMREVARVLKPGGRVALVDFIFTSECVVDLRNHGVQAERVRDDRLSFWISAILNFGAVKTYHVVGMKM
jgi:arsenite methyltransferase